MKPVALDRLLCLLVFSIVPLKTVSILICSGFLHILFCKVCALLFIHHSPVLHAICPGKRERHCYSCAFILIPFNNGITYLLDIIYNQFNKLPV